MTEADKVKVINTMVADTLEYYGEEGSDFMKGILVAISSVCDCEVDKNVKKG